MRSIQPAAEPGRLPHGKLEGTVADALAAERPELMQMPRSFDGFVEHTKRVSPTCLVTFERTRYSVPASFANRPVSLRAYADRIVVAAEGKLNLRDHFMQLIDADDGLWVAQVTAWATYKTLKTPQALAAAKAPRAG